MKRGGSRKHPADCTCGKCPKIGRPKVARSTTPTVAADVLRERNAKALWNEMVEVETALMRSSGKTGPLRDTLKYLEDRAHGKPMDTVNHLHDKPIDLNVNVNLGQRLAAARKRALGR